MKATGDEAAPAAALRGGAVNVEWLGIETCCKGDDRLLAHNIGGRGELLPGLKFCEIHANSRSSQERFQAGFDGADRRQFSMFPNVACPRA